MAHHWQEMENYVLILPRGERQREEINKYKLTTAKPNRSYQRSLKKSM